MLTQIGSLPIIQTPLFLDEPWLVHGFGLRAISIEKYLEAFQLRDVLIPDTRQVHGNKVHLLKEPCTFLEGDAFVTDVPNLVCFVRTADCLPILLADTKHHVIGAIHSGWRGTAQKIVLEVLKRMAAEWGTSPKDLKVAMGPAIGGHCYQVGLDVVEALKKSDLFPGPWVEATEKERWFFDNAFANLFMLEEAGVAREQMYLSLACTACDLEKFASYRREGKKRGEQASFVMKRDDGP